MPYAGVQNAALPGSIADDHGVMLGSVGSDLWHARSDDPSEFWMLTDRGPSSDINVRGDTRRVFAMPNATPLLLHVKLQDGAMKLLETVAVVGRSGAPVTGIPNSDKHDDPMYDLAGKNRVNLNPSGLDTEGLVHSSRGEFWVADEYGPSIVQVDSTGQVVRRLVPEGVNLTGSDYPVEAVLPAIFSRRNSNRGFESLTMSRDERTIYAALQSPLSNPDNNAADKSRTTRLLAMSTETGRPTAEYAYEFDDPKSFQRGAEAKDLQISALAWINPNTLLVLERTDEVSKLYAASFQNATNLLGSPWDNPSTKKSLESLSNLRDASVTPLQKQLVVDLSQIRGVPLNLEGIAIVDAQTIAVANDNDFDIKSFTDSLRANREGVKSQVALVTLPNPLPLD